jgi:hypothetical protein
MYCKDCHVPLQVMDIYCWCCGKPTYENTLTLEEVTALGKECYQCGKNTQWLAPDSRCGECTAYTPEMITGVEDIEDEVKHFAETVTGDDYEV